MGSNTVVWSNRMRTDFVMKMAETASSFPLMGGKHNYLSIEKSNFTTTDRKANALSYETLLEASTSVANASDTLSLKELTDFSSAFGTISDHFKNKEAAWYYKLPIISWLYHSAKQDLVDRATLLRLDLQIRLAKANKQFRDAFQEGCVVESAVAAFQQLSSPKAEAGDYCVWIADDGHIAYLIKPALRAPTAADTVYTKTHDFASVKEKIESEVTNLTQELPAHEDPKEAMPQDVNHAPTQSEPQLPTATQAENGSVPVQSEPPLQTKNAKTIEKLKEHNQFREDLRVNVQCIPKEVQSLKHGEYLITSYLTDEKVWVLLQPIEGIEEGNEVRYLKLARFSKDKDIAAEIDRILLKNKKFFEERLAPKQS